MAVTADLPADRHRFGSDSLTNVCVKSRRCTGGTFAFLLQPLRTRGRLSPPSQCR